ncbi:MAG: hypothetical protein HYR96_04430 [Deltaproteobacteria bacterium]|nr:hypothetical protein [Deltaproteobacteria bacterium]
MGGAITADAYGYLANFYNPAGIAKQPRRKYEIILFDLDAVGSLSMIGNYLYKKSPANFEMANALQLTPGKFGFDQFSIVPAFSMRNFSFSILASSYLSGLSDGTNIDIRAGQDLAPIVGTAMNFAGNLIKLGVSVRAHIRNELKGTFAHDAVASDDQIKALSTEGVGYGINAGLLVTLPFKWLPTLGVSWLDVLGTRFTTASHVLNSQASGTPDPIPQSINAALSIHPILAKRFKSTISVEMKHWEDTTLPWQKRFHAGLQLDDDKTFYFWAGLNQMYWSIGIGYRVNGGNLELGSYGADIGAGSTSQEDRRFFFRYTISYQ